MSRILISSGHGLHVAGANDIIDEVTESRKVTDRVVHLINSNGGNALLFHENIERNARDNLNAIIRWHNQQVRDLDVSIHFNAISGRVHQGIGVEVCYREGNAQTRGIAQRIAQAISKSSGLILRRNKGAFSRTDLGFLNQTNRPSVLLEICFVNSVTDVRLYQENFDNICRSIAEVLLGRNINEEVEEMPDYLIRKYSLIDENIPLGLKDELQQAVNMGIVSYGENGFNPMLSEDNIRSIVWIKRGVEK